MVKAAKVVTWSPYPSLGMFTEDSELKQDFLWHVSRVSNCRLQQIL